MINIALKIYVKQKSIFRKNLGSFENRNIFVTYNIQRSKYSEKNLYQLSWVNTKIFNFRKSSYITFVFYIVNWYHVYCYF